MSGSRLGLVPVFVVSGRAMCACACMHMHAGACRCMQVRVCTHAGAQRRRRLPGNRGCTSSAPRAQAAAVRSVRPGAAHGENRTAARKDEAAAAALAHLQIEHADGVVGAGGRHQAGARVAGQARDGHPDLNLRQGKGSAMLLLRHLWVGPRANHMWESTSVLHARPCRRRRRRQPLPPLQHNPREGLAPCSQPRLASALRLRFLKSHTRT